MTPTPRELLAREIHAAREEGLRTLYPDARDSTFESWDALSPSSRSVLLIAADVLLASPALDALVAERVAALAEDRAALVGLARGMFPTTDGLRDPEAWAHQAAELMCEFLAAALTERRPTDD